MPAKRDNAMSGREPHEAGEDEVLTLQEVAAWLKVTPRQVLRLGIPCLDSATRPSGSWRETFGRGSSDYGTGGNGDHAD